MKLNNKYGLIDADGKVLIPIIYDEIYPSGEYYWEKLPLSKVISKGETFFVDWWGKEYRKNNCYRIPEK